MIPKMKMNVRSIRCAGRLVALFVTISASGCASTAAIDQTHRDTAARTITAPAPHENLNSVLWVQSSVEYAAIAEQSYRLAARVLEEALVDSSWTASLEQMTAGDFRHLPPAVVLDVDETVLDNSAYQARLILDRDTYSGPTWNAWAREAAATAVPGALDFTRHAERLGVTVIYLTNREAVVEEPTRDNLIDLGFPVSGETDVVLTRGERDTWSASDKTTRREHVAGRYRVLLLVGDNLGDFLPDVDRAPMERRAYLAPYEDYWGSRWFMLPNPQYGSWEGAVIKFDFAAPADVQLKRKLDSLDPKR